LTDRRSHAWRNVAIVPEDRAAEVLASLFCRIGTVDHAQGTDLALVGVVSFVAQGITVIFKKLVKTFGLEAED
jgi:hypothetical protein